MPTTTLETALLQGLTARAREEQRDAFSVSDVLKVASEDYGYVASSDVRAALWSLIEHGDVALDSARMLHVVTSEKADAA